MKSVLGLLAGIAAAIVAMMAVGLVGSLLFAVEGPAAPARSEAFLSALGSAPLATQIVVLAAWTIAALAGAAAAKSVARVSWPGWAVAGALALLLAGAFLGPLPAWMQVVAVVGPLAGGLLADLLVRGAAPVEPASHA